MNLPLPLQFFFLLLVGWVNRHQDDVIAYLKEENRVLKELRGVTLSEGTSRPEIEGQAQALQASAHAGGSAP